jgi:general secretion pathway protein A
MAKIISIGPVPPPVPAGDVVTQARAEGCSSQQVASRFSGDRVSQLFYEQFGIPENPFGVTPNPRYLYQSRSHADARASLIIGLESGLGFQALIAPPGMGKTTILFDLLERFNRTARTAFLFQSQRNPRDFLRYLISELGSEERETDLMNIQDAINRLLIKERRTGKRTVVIIDEAQSLSAAVLETVRLLSNFETSTEKLLQIVLAGQSQLAKQLATAELIQLHQRISIIRTLAPFDLADTKSYIEHRLRIAGYTGEPLFTPEALRCIWENSHGVPREINTICFNALLLATAAGHKQVDCDVLQEVIADLDPVGVRGSFGSPPKPILTQQVANLSSPEARVSRVSMNKPSGRRLAEYLRFYNLTRKPFDVRPDPSFLCFTSTHSAALATLYSGISQDHAVMALVGIQGTGKSLAAACLLKLLKCSDIQSEYVLGRNLSLVDLLKFVAGKLGSISSHNTEPQPTQSRDDAVQQCTQRHVLLVDDAHDLSLDAIREIQLLAKLQNSQAKLFQVVLAGGPQLDEMLNFDEFRELSNLISIRSYIKPLDERDTEKYIASRLRIAHADSCSAPIFREDALAAICCRTRGIPRLINLICEGALARGHVLRQMSITSTVIEEVAKQSFPDISLEERIPQRNAEDISEVLNAMKFLLECGLNLERSRSGRPSTFQSARSAIPLAS